MILGKDVSGVNLQRGWIESSREHGVLCQGQEYFNPSIAEHFMIGS